MNPGGWLAGADRWRAARRYLDGHRYHLTRLAGALYPDLPRAGSTRLLCRAGWLPARPLDLRAVSLAWRAERPEPAVTGAGGASAPELPRSVDGTPFRSYAAALAALDPPGMFENRVSYRLLDLAVGRERASMEFCAGRYFDGVDVGEAVAHESAELAMRGEALAPARLPFRSAVGDPTDLARRPVLPAISVLTLRRDARTGEARFLLHRRDPERVAHGGGLYQVMPVGVFQPSAAGPGAVRDDLDLWRCVVREYSEELLGEPDRYGDGVTPFDYTAWPFHRSLARAREDRQLRIFYLGTGVDPLSLATDILAVCVIDSGVFDEVFAGLVGRNEEGVVLGAGPGAGHGAGRRAGTANGFEFDERTVRHIVRHEPMQAAGAAVLELAWRHRSAILAS